MSVYVDPKQVVIVNGEEALWAQLKIENLISQHHSDQKKHNLSDDLDTSTITIESDA